ncbi:hypothetical protein SDC9_144939 [bioreactor metagenome]|uniref:Thioredoxin domain-containing protein n=1 Tax=bioreactor metagenome TaxID=1076179 RepID=A0A645EAV0_9ZZZZ
MEVTYLGQAVDTSRRMLDQFWDPEGGGCFLYSKHGEQLISRPKEIYDGALPSGNSMAAVVLSRLSRLTGEASWQQAAHRQLSYLTGAIRSHPLGHSMALLAVSQAVYPSYELVCVTTEETAPAQLTAHLLKNPLPNLTLLLKTSGNQAELETAAPFTGSYPIPQRGAMYYLCHNGACAAPTDDLSALLDPLSPQTGKR